MKIDKLFPLVSRLRTSSDGLSSIETLRATFNLYWNVPHDIVFVSSAKNRERIACARTKEIERQLVDRAGIMSRANQYPYRLRKEAKSELWTLDQPWTYDLRTPQQSREWQKRNWKKLEN
jgi:hypothetical protein